MTRLSDPPGTVKKCRSCEAPIVWATTMAGKQNPLDATPNPEGNLFAWVVGHKLECESVNARSERATKARERQQNRYTSHFSTCPNAKQHRSKV